MRFRSVLFVLLLLPSVAAWSDDAGDHEVGVHVVSVDGEDNVVWRPASEGGFYPYADLVRFDVSETQDDVVIDVEFAADQPAPQDPTEFWGILAVMEFKLRGFEMVGAMQWFIEPFLADFSGFVLGVPDPDDTWYGLRPYAAFPAEVDGAHLVATIPKSHFRTPDFAPLREGDVLEDVRVSVRPYGFSFSVFPFIEACNDVGTDGGLSSRGGCRFKVRDQVGDDGPEGDVAIELAPEGVGHLLLRAPLPFRFSNGLATTYLFDVTLHNFDDVPDDVALSAVGVPKDWTVLHPERVHFDGAGAQSVPVAVTVPFVHQHGSENRFTMQALGRDDATTEVDLGVVFADPPQPAGHHDTLWFHADPDGRGSAWMNAWEEDPDGGGETAEAGSSFGSVVPPGAENVWNIRLRPGLLMGLDFVVGESARLVADFESPIDREVTFEAELFLVRDEMVPLSEVATQTVAMTGGTPVELDLELPVLAAADRIAPFSGNLVLQVRAFYDVPTPLNAELADQRTYMVMLPQEGSLKLPLVDYHEEVDLTGLDLNVFTVSGGETLKHVNPGRAAAFVFNVTNRLPDADTLDWTLAGDHAEWATVEPASTVVPGEGQGRVVVRVQVPAGATEDDAAELVLRGTSRDDPARQVFVRLTALVDLDDDIPDESEKALSLSADVAQENERLGQDSPLGAWLAVVAVSVALVVARRR